MSMKLIAIKIHRIIASQIGFDPRIFLRSISSFPIYLCDWFKFRGKYKGNMCFSPCLQDRFEEGGITKSEYFWQDLLVARAVYEAMPVKHVDIGSRVDGFVAHVASFRGCEVFDVRPIRSAVPGITFYQADLMSEITLPISQDGYCDSLSCLHAIEHFGLGRYGDPIDPKGYQKGIANISKLIKFDGTLYLSTPIGRERVEFNANWVFDPNTILDCAKANSLELKELIIITAESGPQYTVISKESLSHLKSSDYQLGLFIFKKIR